MKNYKDFLKFKVMRKGINVRVPVTVTEENAKCYNCIIIAPQARPLSPSSPCPSISLLNFLTGCFFILFLSIYFFSSPLHQSSIIPFFFLSFLHFTKCVYFWIFN